MRPLVRIVILNYNGGDLLRRCLESVRGLDWPSERLEVVVVDNGSTDGSAERASEEQGDLSVIRSEANLGYAAGNNLALSSLGDADYVALLNNDALVEPGWLAPLVDALEADPGLGAACPKILYAWRFVEARLEAPAYRPGGVDPRALGVKVSGVAIDGRDRWRDTLFAAGCYGLEHGPREERRFHWTAPSAGVWVPRADPARPEKLALRISAERSKEVTVRCGRHSVEAAVGRFPATVEIPLDGEPFDVIQNAGSVMVEGGYGGDRGFQERDEGQYDTADEVFGWCGCSVLLRRRYLDETGILDPRLFLYYEDFDLSWRGRAQGWRYRYVPEAVVRHLHAASSVEDSPFFIYQVERSRLLVHAKNAPAGYALRAVADSGRATARFAVRDVLRPMLRGHRPYTGLVRLRARALGSFARNLPGVLDERRDLRRRQRVPDSAILSWKVSR